jgi:anti-sigma factor RsiW
MDPIEDQELRRVLKAQSDYFAAPADLRNAILATLVEGAEPTTRDRAPWILRVLAWLVGPLPRLGMAFATGVIVTLVGLRILTGSHGGEALENALISDHARALMTGQTIEVASSSSHTVKPWLSTKLGYSPNVVDLAKEGFPLMGGRRGFLGTTPVAIIVYAYREHEIDVYALRGDEAEGITNRAMMRDGYNMRSWTEGEMRYVAISDVAADRLDEFVRRVHQLQASPVD